MNNMWLLTVLSNTSAIAASIAVVYTAFIILQQLKLQKSSVDTEEKRFTRESAQFVFESLQKPAFREARARILDVFRTGRDAPKGQAEINDFRLVLSEYEMLGLCLKLESIDEKFWKEYWGRTLVRDWIRLESFVNSERQKFGNPKLFSDAENVVQRWRADFL